MTVEYVVRFEDRDLVCHLVVDGTDYVTIHRIACACQDDDWHLCASLIEICQRAAEMDAGRMLGWVFTDETSDLRVCWTGQVDLVDPDMVGSPG